MQFAFTTEIYQHYVHLSQLQTAVAKNIGF